MRRQVYMTQLQSQRIWQDVVQILSWMMSQEKPADLKSSVQNAMSQDVSIISSEDVQDVRVTRENPDSIFLLRTILCACSVLKD